ncbi:MAG: hypothetical protein OEV94_11920 [Deltaproteobacteria bacterium]|nr:hypothetical protein [Deltaproteobacteria bacterium]
MDSTWRLLQQAVDCCGYRQVGKAIGYNHSTLNQVLSGKYKGQTGVFWRTVMDRKIQLEDLVRSHINKQESSTRTKPHSLAGFTHLPWVEASGPGIRRRRWWRRLWQLLLGDRNGTPASTAARKMIGR